MTDPADSAATLAGDVPANGRAVGGRPENRIGAGDPASNGSADARAQRPDEQALGGRYVLTERIASGGMASVWRATDRVLARTVAVKVLHDHLAADADFRERFRREAIAAARLTHPGVVNLYDTGSDGDQVYLVMEYVEGATLRDVIAERGVLEPGQAAAIAERIARALHYAHERGLVHRDVKPANILIGDDGAVKVADFGIAKAEETGGDLTRTGMVLGTAAYVAPEQITGSAIDGRADQYALGCVLFEALTGRPPFRGDTPVVTAAQRLEMVPPALRSLRPELPAALEDIVAKALARSPHQRYPSAGAFADALAAHATANTGQTAALAFTTPSPNSGRLAPADRIGSPRRRPAGPSGESFLRTEGRWLAAVLALIVGAGGLIAVGLASGAIDSGQLTESLPALGGDPQASEPDDAATAPAGSDRLPVASSRSLDPQGDDGEENEARVAALHDSDPATTWRTSTYYSAAFGGLKNGVGVVLDLGEVQRVTGVAVQTDTPGVNYEIRLAAGASDDPAGYSVAAAVTDAGEREEVGFGEPVDARFLLLWITPPLPAGGGGYLAEFAEVVPQGLPLTAAGTPS